MGHALICIVCREGTKWTFVVTPLVLLYSGSTEEIFYVRLGTAFKHNICEKEKKCFIPLNVEVCHLVSFALFWFSFCWFTFCFFGKGLKLRCLAFSWLCASLSFRLFVTVCSFFSLSLSPFHSLPVFPTFFFLIATSTANLALAPIHCLISSACLLSLQHWQMPLATIPFLFNLLSHPSLLPLIVSLFWFGDAYRRSSLFDWCSVCYTSVSLLHVCLLLPLLWLLGPHTLPSCWCQCLNGPRFAWLPFWLFSILHEMIWLTLIS